MREYKIIAAIADIHIGVRHITAATLKQQLKDHFLQVLKDLKHLDLICILGDILHSALSLNSDYSELYLWFINKVYKIAKQRKCAVIIIRGTRSHDNDQLQNIRSYINNDDGVDFRIYETFAETTIWDNYKLLILPDIQVKKKSDVEKYLTEDKKYDLILGHGLIDRMRYFIQDSETMPTHTYEYSVEKLIDSCKGPVLFGHIHQYQCILDHFWYVGPFTLLERGGIDAGFAICGIYDKDRTKFRVEHYINPDSATYYEIKITKKILEQEPIDKIIEAIDDIIKDAKLNDLISLKITRGDNLESSDKVAILENRYRKDRRFSIVKKIKSKREEEREKENKDRKEKFSYLMDNNLTISDIFYKYYKNEVVPTLPDQFSPVATLTLDQFKSVFGE